MANNYIEFNKVLEDSRETLLNPRSYFSSMSTKGGYQEPVIKAVIYGLIAGLISLLWAVFGLSPMGGIMWNGAAGIMALLFSMIGSIIGLFIGGAIMSLISAICGGHQELEANVRVASALMVVYPINAFMAFLYGVNKNLGSVVGLLVSFYSIYLLYQASIYALKGKESVAKIVAIALLGLTLLVFFGGRKATRTIEDISDRYEREMVD